jgi:exoribonuclease R
VGAPYAHVTAPLRRLADRHVNEVVLALAGDHAPPPWAADALADLAEVMRRADRRAGAVARACVDAVEVVVLAAHVGDAFPATVVDRHRRGAVVLLADVPVVVTVAGDRPPLGEDVTVRLETLDPVTRTLTFALLPR